MANSRIRCPSIHLQQLKAEETSEERKTASRHWLQETLQLLHVYHQEHPEQLPHHLVPKLLRLNRKSLQGEQEVLTGGTGSLCWGNRKSPKREIKTAQNVSIREPAVEEKGQSGAAAALWWSAAAWTNRQETVSSPAGQTVEPTKNTRQCSHLPVRPCTFHTAQFYIYICLSFMQFLFAFNCLACTEWWHSFFFFSPV